MSEELSPQSATEEAGTQEDSSASPSFSGPIKIVLLIAVIGVVGFSIWKFGDQLSLSALAERETEFRQFQSDHPVMVYGVAFLVYVAVAGLSLPGAAGMTLIIGWLFGFWSAMLIVSFGSTAGATVAFLLSRYLMRDAIQNRFGDRLTKFNEALEREGAFYLFTLRLIPVVPFFVINVVMGLTPLRVTTFWWVSQVGMIPGTAAYVYAGTSVPDLQTLATKGAGGIISPQLLGAFVILGLLPIVIKKILSWTTVRREGERKGEGESGN